MEGGKSRNSYVDFIRFFFNYKENNRLVEGLCWAQNVLFGAKSVMSKLCLKWKSGTGTGLSPNSSMVRSECHSTSVPCQFSTRLITLSDGQVG